MKKKRKKKQSRTKKEQNSSPPPPPRHPFHTKYYSNTTTTTSKEKPGQKNLYFLSLPIEHPSCFRYGGDGCDGGGGDCFFQNGNRLTMIHLL